jgi:hypothetical protein
MRKEGEPGYTVKSGYMGTATAESRCIMTVRYQPRSRSHGSSGMAISWTMTLQGEERVP